MAAGITDLFTQATNGTRPVPTTLTSSRAISAATISCGALTGWPTGTAVHFIIYTVNTSGEKVAGSQTDWKGIVSGTTITNCTLKAGSDSGDSIGAIVECGPSAAWANDIVAGMVQDHGQLGYHKNLTDANGNEWIKQTATSSAVNEITIANAATGNDPVISATGDDTNVGLTLTPKGTGSVKLTKRADGWVTGLTTPTTITALGNRSYSVVVNSTDYTDRLSPGMRLRMTRTVTAPTQCTDLESGSSQYFNKTSPNKLTFTDDFTVSAWIKVESYPSAGNITPIVSRSNGTSGWFFTLNEYGQVFLNGHNAAIGNYSRVTSTQSVPIGKWIHIAGQLDMSAFTATPTTSYIMFDGVDVPATVTRAGSNPTALVQAGDLNIGQYNSGTASSYFDGKIAQVAIYNAKVTQATILASMHQTLTGSETSLASAYSFNNSITDLNTTTPNDLTAQGSALATSADTPYAQGATGTTEYGIITAASFSTNTTLTVQVPVGCAIPTSGGVSALSYSTQKSPYGFPSDRSLWRVETLSVGINTSVAIGATSQWYASSLQLTAPVGSWIAGYSGGLQKVTNVAAAQTGYFLVAPATPTNADYKNVLSTAIYNGAAVIAVFAHVEKSTAIALSGATTYILYGATPTASGTESYSVNGTIEPFVIFADCAYL